MRIKPGYIQRLPVLEAVEKGYLLGTESDHVFIARRELRPQTEPGTEVEVFVFYNEEKDLEATTRLPQIQVGEVGVFRALNGNDLGFFLDIGTRRDVLLPRRECADDFEEGRMALVVLLDDAENRRLVASTKVVKHLRTYDIPYKRGDEVSMIIGEKIEIGRRVIIDGKYVGALFRQEMMQKVRLGEKLKGYIRKVEGKDIVVSMQREGLDLLDDAKASLMAYLEMNGGYVRLSDDTDPEEVKLRLHMSKKTFKRAAGMLFKEGKVLLTKFGVKINKTGVVPDSAHAFLNEEDEEDEVKPFYGKKPADKSSDGGKRPAAGERKSYDDKKGKKEHSDDRRKSGGKFSDDDRKKSHSGERREGYSQDRPRKHSGSDESSGGEHHRERRPSSGDRKFDDKPKPGQKILKPVRKKS